MVRLLLIRHGRTDWNAQGRYQGQTDVALSEMGRRQAAAAARAVAGEGIDAVYTSDLRRAWETAQAIVDGRGLPSRQEPRLREMSFGRWEGLTYAELAENHGEALARWENDPARVRPPQGETLAEVAERVGAVLNDLRSAPAEATIALVGHGGSFQVLLCMALGVPVEGYWQFRLAPASVSEVALYEKGAIVSRLNDTHHLSGLADDPMTPTQG